MKVEGTATPFGVAYTKSVSATKRKSGKPEKSDSDEVQLSDLISQMNTSEDSFDAARVAEIKQAISEGRFSINADAIADRLIASAQELLAHRKR